MKSFFQSFSFLRDKQSFKSTLDKVEMGWSMPRFFVIALISSIVSFVYTLSPAIVQIYTNDNRTANNVSKSLNIVGDNFLSVLPKDFSATFSSGGLFTNLQQPLVIPYRVIFSGQVDSDFLAQKGINKDSGFIVVDTVSASPDLSLRGFIFTQDRIISTLNGEVKQRLYNEKLSLNDMQDQFVVSYDSLQKVIFPQLYQWVLKNWDYRFNMFSFVIFPIFFLLNVLFMSLVQSLYIILVAYIWNCITRAIANIMKKGRDYTTSYSHTILATFPIFILNRFIEISWYIDIVVIVVLVFVADYVSQKNHNS